MCTTNWKCILSSLCEGGSTGVLYIVIWRMSICTGVFPRLECWTTRQQQLEMAGFKVDAFNIRWEIGPHLANRSPSCLLILLNQEERDNLCRFHTKQNQVIFFSL